MPRVFAEQGVSMLSAILRSDTAIDASVRIMDGFAEMRHFVAGNAAMFEQIRAAELKQLECQKTNDKRFERIFDHMETRGAPKQKVFFDDQAYDAFELPASLVQQRNEVRQIAEQCSSLLLQETPAKQRGHRPQGRYRMEQHAQNKLGMRYRMHIQAPTKLRQATTPYLCQRIKLIRISGGRSVPFKQPAIFGKAFEDTGCCTLPAADMLGELRRRNLAVCKREPHGSKLVFAQRRHEFRRQPVLQRLATSGGSRHDIV